MGMGKKITGAMAPHAVRAAPELTSGFVLEALDRAVKGVGPLPPAAFLCWKVLREADGKVERAVQAIVTRHVKYAAAQGFATNIGGLVTSAVTLPANVTGLALIQCRMIACIAHLYGADLEDPSLRTAVLATLAGPDTVKNLRKKGKLPGSPGELLNRPSDSELEKWLAAKVAGDLITQVTGKRLATTVGRKVPMIGGAVGMSADGFATWQVGKYAEREFRAAGQRPRTRR
ncbi:EcsC family protein [Nocardioides daejeonensis]|uniref:EcsC family protein n=1 Tax=Nocardioides daejeonensis TaxID=1046556 RepID=UPI000D749994|nr:EcsC family protein [Nocardioides daejeonensis]